MRIGDIKTDKVVLSGIKVESISLKENELWIGLKGRKSPGRFSLNLKGIISFRDDGVHGKPIANYTIADRGSYREIAFNQAKGAVLLRCEYMEGEIVYQEKGGRA